MGNAGFGGGSATGAGEGIREAMSANNNLYVLGVI
jgi:hypothetical protein